MSYQTELSSLAVKTANGSFSNIVELSKILAVFGTKKEVKLCWVENCENNGLLQSTANDYYALAVIVGSLVIKDYKDAKASSVTILKARLDAIGVTSIKTLKTYKSAQKECAILVQSLMEFRTLDGENADLELLIESLSTLTRLSDLLDIIEDAQEFIIKLGNADADADAKKTDFVNYLQVCLSALNHLTHDQLITVSQLALKRADVLMTIAA